MHLFGHYCVILFIYGHVYVQGIKYLCFNATQCYSLYANCIQVENPSQLAIWARVTSTIFLLKLFIRYIAYEVCVCV